MTPSHLTVRRVVGYVRVHTDTHNGGELTGDTQLTKIRAQAVVLGLDLSDVIMDAGPSAATLEWPGFTRLLVLVEDGLLETVIIARLDRLARSGFPFTDLLARFERRQVALVSVAEELNTRDASGRLVVRILASVSRWERDANGERTRDVLQVKKTNGERVGNVPFGSQLAEDGVHLEPAPHEQRLLARMRALEHEGRSVQEIVDDLNRNGFQTRRGTRWRYQHVAHLLRKAHAP
jgi:DNA invertase Pin-like site-specific DNA recombinase